MRSLAKRAVCAAWIGSALEYYDFFLYNTAAVLYLGPLFFPDSRPLTATLYALISVGAGYISRPIGAVVLGYLGDVYGRRWVLFLSLFLMGTAALAMGLLPTYADVGIAAPVSLVCLRLIQGFAISGEQAGAQILLLELSPERRRGFYASFALSGSFLGFIGASTVYLCLTWFLPESDMCAWGWRLPFAVSCLLVVVGLWVRYRLPESSVFTDARRLQDVRPMPLKTLWFEHKRDVSRVVLATQVSVISTIIPVFSLPWAVHQFNISKQVMLGMLVAGAVVGVISAPVWGGLSDKLGRRPVFVFGALSSAGLIWPYLWSISNSHIVLLVALGILVGGVTYPAASAVWASLYGEMFKTKVRFSGVAIGTQLGLMISAQAPILAMWFTQESPAHWPGVAVLVSVSCALAALAVLASKETNRVGTLGLGCSDQ